MRRLFLSRDIMVTHAEDHDDLLSSSAWEPLATAALQDGTFHEMTARHFREKSRGRQSTQVERKWRWTCELTDAFKKMPSSKVPKDDGQEVLDKVTYAKKHWNAIQRYRFGRGKLRHWRFVRRSKGKSQLSRYADELVTTLAGENGRLLLFYGDAIFPAGTRGCPPGPHKAIIQELTGHPRVVVVVTTEFRTSKLCARHGVEVESAKANTVTEAKDPFGRPAVPDKQSIRTARTLRKRELAQEDETNANADACPSLNDDDDHWHDDASDDEDAPPGVPVEACGSHVMGASRAKVCSRCAAFCHRDRNAAVNILVHGITLLLAGDTRTEFRRDSEGRKH